MSEENPIYTRQVLDMFTVANEFCIFVESAGKYNAEQVLDYMAKVSPLLYLKGVLLPGVEVDYPEANERFVNEETWQDIFNAFRQIMGEKDIFLRLDPFGPDPSFPIEASFSEHIADVYQDMKDFVLLFGKESEVARQNAVHELGQLFKSRWGIRVIEIQQHAHRTIYHEFLGNENTEYEFE